MQRGAQWFHGTTSANPVYTYATKTLKLPTVISDGNDVTFDGTATDWPATLVDSKTKQAWNGLFEDFETKLGRYYQENWPKGRITSSLEDALKAFIAENDIAGSKDELAFRQQIDTNYVQEYAASPGQLSLWYFDNDKRILGDDAIASNGYNTVFRTMYEDLVAGNAVRLGAVVTQVTRTGSGVQVSCVHYISDLFLLCFFLLPLLICLINMVGSE